MGTASSKIITNFTSLSTENRSENTSLENCKPALDIPEGLIIDILSYVPASDLIKNCNLVCKQWMLLIDCHTLWKLKCVRDKKVIPPCKLSELPSNYYKQIYFCNPYGRNLVKNPSGEEGFTKWECTSNGGDRFTVENPPNGADEIPKEACTQSCFVTSYGECTKHQVIDLLQEGIHTEILKSGHATICISEWHAGRFDCGYIYKLNVSLLNENYKEIDEFHSESTEEQWVGRAWTQTSHTFENVEDVRYIRFEHSGNDTQFWAGHYGSKMTAASVRIGFKK